MMTTNQKNKLEQDLLKAINKVIEQSIDSSAFVGFIIPNSMSEMAAKSAMATIENLMEYHDDLVNGGYVKD